MKTSLLTGTLVVALAAPLLAERAEDDLQVVRRAVAGAQVAQATSAAEEPAAPRAETAPRPRPGDFRWFRVRIVEKGGKRGRVSVNLPLGLVRSLGDDWPIGGRDRSGKGRRGPTLGDVLRALDSGQTLVEIEDDDASVRVWVD